MLVAHLDGFLGGSVLHCGREAPAILEASGLPRPSPTLARFKLLICNRLRSCRLTSRQCRGGSRVYRSTFPLLVLSTPPHHRECDQKRSCDFNLENMCCGDPSGRQPALAVDDQRCPTAGPLQRWKACGIASAKHENRGHAALWLLVRHAFLASDEGVMRLKERGEESRAVPECSVSLCRCR